ncbi:Paf1 complex component [Rhizina undulata]
MSSPESAASPSAEGSSPAANNGSTEKPTGNKYDQMFGSDNESAPAEEEEDDAEDAGVRKRSRKSDGDNTHGGDAAHDDEDADGDDDLFGDDMVDEPQNQKEHEGTPEIDHDDDEPERVYRSIDVSLPRHPVPDPGDEDIYLLRVPNFISMQQQLFYPETFTLPKIHADSSTSAYTVATNTVRVRQSPADPTKLQSNARIIRWSDGTLSLQIASSTNLYDLPSKSLAPSHKKPAEYEPSQDSHTYLLTPHESAGMLRVLGHATQALGVLPAVTSLQNDDAITKLSEELSAAIASRAGRRGTGKNIEISDMKDPEAQRREAERLDRERQRQAKKIENQKKKSRDTPGVRDESGAARPRYNPRSSHTRSKRESPPLTKGPGRTREDEYDLDDGFVEGTDEEEELEESDEEEDSDEDRRRKKAKGKKRKEKEVPVEEDEEEEAAFTDEERPAKLNAGRGKRRRVVDDEDEEEE